MATIGVRPQDTASRYGSIYQNPESRFDIRGAKVVGGRTNQTLTSRPSEDGRRKRTVPKYQGANEYSKSDQNRQNAKVAERYYLDDQSNVSQAGPITQTKTKIKVTTSVATRARGVLFGITSFSWVLWWFFMWQLPIAIVGAIMFGLVSQIEASYVLTAIDTATQAVGSLFGYEYVDLQGLAMLCTITAAFFGVLSAGICAFTAVLWRLHPLSGNASGAKIATFIVGIIGACIPFANMFPWIVFWILVMMRHPK